MADTRSLADAMLTAETAGRSLGSLDPSARDALTGAYARRRCPIRQNGNGPARKYHFPDEANGNTENRESRCAAPMRTDDTQSEPTNTGPVTK